MKKYLMIFLWLVLGSLCVQFLSYLDTEANTFRELFYTMSMLAIGAVYLGTMSNLVKVPSRCFHEHWNTFLKHNIGLFLGFSIAVAGIIVSSLSADNALIFVGFLISLGGIALTIEYGYLTGDTFERMRRSV